MHIEQPMPDDDATIDFGGVAAALWRAKRWIVPIVLLTAVATYGVLSVVDPIYKADNQVLIETRSVLFDPEQRRPADERAVLDAEGIASQKQLLESRDLARRVAKKLKLATRPEFDAVGSGSTSLISDVMALLGIGKDPLRLSPEERVLEKYYERLNVFTIKGSRVIAVEFSSKDPRTAAQVANAVVAEYLDMQAAAKQAVTRNAVEIMKPEVERLLREVKAAERRAVEYRAGADLMFGRDNITLVQQQLAELNSQLATARAARSEAGAKAQLINNLLKDGKSTNTSSDVLASTLIQRLRERQVALKARIAEISITLLANHPQIKALKSQLGGLDKQIRVEVRKILRGLENDVQIADTRVASLQASLNETKAAAAKSSGQMVKLRELERDAQIKSTQLETLLARYRRAETGKNAAALPADARVVSRALPPAKPFWPKKKPTTAVTTLAMALLCIVLVIIREFASGRAIRQTQFAQTPINLPIEPALMPVEAGPAEVTDAVNPRYHPGHSELAPEVSNALTTPADPAAVAGSVIDTPQALVAFTRSAGTPRTRLLITSVISDQESERAAAMIAAAAAVDGRTLLIDAHESAMVRTEKLTGRRMPGLGELITSRASFDSVIFRPPDSRNHRIGCGNLSEALAEPGAVERLMLTLDALDHTYDMVVLDLGAIDALEISAKLIHQSDLVVLADGREVCQATALALAALSSTGDGDVLILSEGQSNHPGIQTRAA